MVIVKNYMSNSNTITGRLRITRFRSNTIDTLQQFSRDTIMRHGFALIRLENCGKPCLTRYQTSYNTIFCTRNILVLCWIIFDNPCN